MLRAPSRISFRQGSWRIAPSRLRLAAAQVFELTAQPIAARLCQVRCPMKIPLVVFLPGVGEIPDVLCHTPVTNPGGSVFRDYARAFACQGEITGRVGRQTVTITVFPLNVMDQTLPVCSGDFLFRVLRLGYPGRGSIHELRRHIRAQPES